jgi:hypothetical protein
MHGDNYAEVRIAGEPIGASLDDALATAHLQADEADPHQRRRIEERETRFSGLSGAHQLQQLSAERSVNFVSLAGCSPSRAIYASSTMG